MEKRSHWILLAGVLAFHACTGHSGSQTANPIPGNPSPVKGVVSDSSAPPMVIPITTANRPKVVVAGKPFISPDSSSGGIPFFTNYGMEEGLSLPTIWGSFTDKAGNLWFATDGEGACVYNGKSFTKYTIDQGLVSNGVYCITQDNQGNIWFGTTSGASRYDGKTFTNFSKAQGLSDDIIDCIIQDRQGNIWFSTRASGAIKFDGKTFTNFLKAQGMAANDIRCSLQDSIGNIWFGTVGGGVSKYDGKGFRNYTKTQGLANDSVYCMLEDRMGNIWFGTNGGGVSKFDGKTFTNYSTHQGLVSNWVMGMFQDRCGNIWFATRKGISRFDGKNFANYSSAQGLPNDWVMCITPDKEDHLWFGTNGGGISEYGGYSSTGYQTSQRLDISTTYCILRDKKGDIWFGANGGVIKYDGKTFANYTVAQGLPANTVVSMMQDRSGNIWFGTNRGASKFNGKTFTNYTTAQGLASDYVRSIVQDRSGNIWFCFSHRGGASKYDGKSFSRFTTAQGLPKNYVFSMTPDKSGDVWFATDSGASKFDGRRFTNFTIRQGLQSNHILCLTQDSKGDLWFGTDKGASKYDGERFTNFTTSNGLPNNSIWSIVEDSTRNMMWLGTDLGISGLKQNSSGAGYAFQNFSIKTGDYIKDIYGLGFDNNGILWLGCSGNKLIRFDYEAVHKSAAPLEVEIQNIKVNNEYICWNSLRKGSLGHPSTDSLAQLNEMVTTFGAMLSAASLDSMRNKFGDLKFDSLTPFNPVPVNLCLPYHDNNISFDFVAIEPALPKQVKYQYKLEGFDEDWAPPGNASLAVYSNLREGVYTFRLKALSPYGVWSETSYRFKVLPPWQRTWWAYTLFAVAVIGMLWGVIYYRSRRLRRANLFLEEKVAHRTNQLQESLEDLKSAQSQLVHAEKMASLGELTAGIAHEIQNPLNFINNFSEVNQELLAEMKEEIDKGNFGDVKSTAGNVMENEQKILHHGKRADAIVKGMLQHSRTSTGLKEPTDINGLADEYLRLSYHGIRAKEKGFHAETKTAYDENIGNVPVVPQDIGRVLLNLYNNAFYAVAEKEKLLPSGYEPSVAVSTKKTGDRVEIRVRDNGMGIPQKAVDKIFQPFFTTKPAGSGTGLGLSLSYDIIKAHGGEITVQTKEGEGTEFVVRL